MIKWQFVKRQLLRGQALKGQVILELLWVTLFICTFLSIMSFMYEKGKQEIRFSRQIKSTN